MPLAEHDTPKLGEKNPDLIVPSTSGIASALNLQDRRDSYRVHIPGALSRPSIALEGEDGAVKGRLLDISRNGAAALLQVNFDAPVGSFFPCHIGLPDGHFRATAEVRSSKTIRNHLRLGLLFTDLSITQHYHIDTSIATLERSLLRDYSFRRK